MGSPSLIASTGHSGTHVPQARQASLILWAIEKPPPFKVALLELNFYYYVRFFHNIAALAHRCILYNDYSTPQLRDGEIYYIIPEKKYINKQQRTTAPAGPTRKP
jgi:hypothetical protein